MTTASAETALPIESFYGYFDAEIAPDLAAVRGRTKILGIAVVALWCVCVAGFLVMVTRALVPDRITMDKDTVLLSAFVMIFGGAGGAIVLRKLASAPFKRILVGRTCAFLGLDYAQKNFQFPLDSFRAFEIVPRFRKGRLRDRIGGKHGDVRIKACEARLTDVHDRSGGKGTRTESREVFSGLLLLYTFPVSFRGRTVVLPDATWLGNKLVGTRQSGERITLEDPRFERQYEVYASDQVEARALLTPSFMERLRKLAGQVGVQADGSKQLSLAFDGDKLAVAISTTRDFFEGGSILAGATVRERAEELLAQIRMIFDIVDVLKPAGAVHRDE